VCHTAAFDRQLLREKLEVQRKQLPEWYAPEVSDEIDPAIENVDWAQVALIQYLRDENTTKPANQSLRAGSVAHVRISTVPSNHAS
jgi:hypothetical protein